MEPSEKFCEYCQIAASKIPAKLAYSDENVFALIPETPITEGHVIVAPRTHYETIFTIDATSLDQVIKTARKLAHKLEEKNNVDGVSIIHASADIIGRSHDHFHLHIIPRTPGDGLDLWIQNRQLVH